MKTSFPFPKSLAFIALLCLGLVAHAQSVQEPPVRGPRPYTRLNSVQFELLGNGGHYSLNYERILVNGPRFKTAARIGAAVWSPPIFVQGMLPELWMPMLVNEQISFGSHHLQGGAGLLLTNFVDFPGTNFRFVENGGRVVYPYATGELGYRFQRPECRLMFKLSYTPFYRLYTTREFFENALGGRWGHSGGLAVGYAF